MALAVEAAELMEHFQWLREQQSATLSPEKKDAVAQELADVLIYLVRLSSQLDIDLESAAWNKLDLNRQKYPVEKARRHGQEIRRALAAGPIFRRPSQTDREGHFSGPCPWRFEAVRRP